MIVSAARLDRWRDEVALAAQDAELAARSEVAIWLSGHPECTVEEAREAAIKSVEKASASYCRISSATSGKLYEELAKEQGASARFKVIDTTDRAYTEERARWCAGLLRKGDRAGFVDNVAAVAGQQVRRNAVASMEENCRRSKVRWARVPTGKETCSWCFMLASRGFVYRSAQTAQAGWHRGCDCAIVPDFDGNTQVQGYDPDGLYSRWKMCADTVQLDPMSDTEEVTKAIMRECDTRDPQWLWTGKAPKITFETDVLRIEIERSRPHEIDTANRLRRHGVRCDFVDDSEGLADFASGAEIKTLLGTSSRNTIESHLKSTSKKKNVRVVYFDNAGNAEMGDKELEGYLAESRRFKRGSIYVIRHDESLKKVR